MKNVFWLITVCITFGLYSCSTNTEEKVVNNDIENTNDIANVVEKEADSLESELAEVVPTTEKESKEITEKASTSTNTPEKSSGKKEASVKTEPSNTKPTTKPNQPKPVKEEIVIEEQTAKPAVKDLSPPPPPTKPKPVTKPEPEPIVEDEAKEEIKEMEIADPTPILSHEGFDALLKKHVSSSGNVNYAGFKKDQAKLEIYLKHLEMFPPQSRWSKNKKLAYWFNLYNAWTIKTIIDKYPVASITDIDGGKTWNVKRVKSGNNAYSLDEVENKIIRPRFKDARIHFAVNCAAKSCPPLLNKAWTESNTSSYLEKQTKSFINNTNYNQITDKKVKISKIFEWYAVDFGDIISYLNKYSDTKINQDAKVEYIEYDLSMYGN